MPCHHITLFLAEFVEVIAVALRTHPDVVRRTSMPFWSAVELSPLVEELATTPHGQKVKGISFRRHFDSVVCVKVGIKVTTHSPKGCFLRRWAGG
jgi:hypothetical protein